MTPPVGILFAAATITGQWFVALSWRIYGPRFVRGMKGTGDPLGGGQA